MTLNPASFKLFSFLQALLLGNEAPERSRDTGAIS